jgi:GDP-mannose transporter
MTAFIFLVLAVLGLHRLPRISPSALLSWIPVTVLFLAMIYTGQKSLEYLHVPTYTVFKNTCTFVITIGDHIFYDNTSSALIWFAEIIMVRGCE